MLKISLWASPDTASIKEHSLSAACQGEDRIEDQAFPSSLHPKVLKIVTLGWLMLCVIVFLSMVWSDDQVPRCFYLCDHSPK